MPIVLRSQTDGKSSNVSLDSLSTKDFLSRFTYHILRPSGTEFWVDPYNGSIILHETIDYEEPKTEVALIVEVGFSDNKGFSFKRV